MSIHCRRWYGNVIVGEDDVELGVCFRSYFRNKFPCTVSIVIDLVLLGFFRHFRYVFVYSIHDHHPWTSSIAKWGVDHDLDSVTALITSKTGPIFVFPRIHPILSLWITCRPRGDVHSRHEPPNLSSSTSSRVVKYCPFATVFATVFTIPALEHSLINGRWSERFANFRSWACSKFPCTVSLVRSGLCVVDHFCWQDQGLRLVQSNKFPSTFWTIRESAGQFVTHVRQCSVDTELMEVIVRRTTSAVSSSPQKWKDNFPFPLLFKVLVPKHCIHGMRDVHFHWSWSLCPQRRDPILHSACTCEFRTISFLIQAQEMTQCPCANLLTYSAAFMEFAIHISLFPFFSPYNVVAHWHEDDSSWKLLKLTLYFSHHVHDLCEVLQCSESWENCPLELHRLPVVSIQFSTLGWIHKAIYLSPSMRLRDFLILPTHNTGSENT